MFNIVTVPGLQSGTLIIAGAQNALHSNGVVQFQVVNLLSPFKVGDIVTRDGTDLQRVTGVNAACDLIDVECVHEALGYRLEDGIRREAPWCRVGDVETNLASRYSLIEATDALDPDSSLAWLDIITPHLLASDRVDAMTKLRLAARWAEAKA